MRIHPLLLSALVLMLILGTVSAAMALERLSKNPYSGAIVIDAATGKVLFQDRPDVKGYPASVTKLMVLLIILEAVESHHLSLNEPVTVTAEAAKIGGSQVYLKENEVFPVDDLLYALVIQSANDAAAALAIHYAGSKEAFVELMNKRAREIGMKSTVFHTVHGLPPSKRQLPDVSTPRDIARLSQELLKKRNALKYTSTKERTFRGDSAKPFIMRNHNYLLGSMTGCDGLKTGYFHAAGFSVAATASRGRQRAIAVVMGAENRRVRDTKAKEMLGKGLMQLAMSSDPSPPSSESDTIQIRKSTVKTVGAGIGGLMILGVVLYAIRNRLPGRFPPANDDTPAGV